MYKYIKFKINNTCIYTLGQAKLVPNSSPLSFREEKKFTWDKTRGKKNSK